MAKLKFSTTEVALREAMGNVSAAARRLGVSRGGLEQYVKKNPKLIGIIDDARQAMCDNAESSLNRAVISGEAWAVCFTLKTQGKSRGYVERVQTEISGRDGEPIEQRTTIFDHSSAVAAIASRSMQNNRESG
jgi:hypothetical protein